MTAPLRSPRAMALAYRIWGYASPRGWNVTADELADALDETPQQIGVTVRRMGWANRLRASEAVAKRDQRATGPRSYLMAEVRELTDELIGEAG